MQCVQCGSDTWDNSAKVADGWKGPLRKCKDKACGWVLWPPKERGATKTSAPVKTSGPKWTWAQLQDTYRNALKIAAALVPTHVKNATASDVVSACATIFICASRDGVAPPPQKLDEKPAVLAAAEKDEEIPWD